MNLSSVSPPLEMFPNSLFCWHSHITNWTCCLQSSHVFACYFSLFWFRHYHWDNFTFEAVRVNYASVSDVHAPNIQSKEFSALSLISGCWNMANFVNLYMHEYLHAFTSKHCLFQWTSEEPTSLSWFSYLSFFSELWSVWSQFLSSFKVMFRLPMKLFFFLTDLLWSKFMPFLSL